MSSFFFYGTLMDPEIVRAVIGRPLSGLSPRVARLEGYKRVYVAAATYPALIADSDTSLEGIVVSRISPIEISRITRYEGADYQARLTTVQTLDGQSVEAQVFFPKAAIRTTNRPWVLDEWRRRDKKRFLAGMRRNMLV